MSVLVRDFVGCGTHVLNVGSVIADGLGIVFGGATIDLYGTFYPKIFAVIGGEVNVYIPFISENLTGLTLTGGNLNFGSVTVMMFLLFSMAAFNSTVPQ